MNDEEMDPFEKRLLALSPRHAPPDLRARVLHSIGIELAQSEHRSWFVKLERGAAFAASILLLISLGFLASVAQSEKGRMARLLPKPIASPYLQDLKKMIAEQNGNGAAEWLDRYWMVGK